MKTLILVRHAKSSWKFPDLDDFDRPLNKRGKRDAPFMGQLMYRKGIKADALVSSPANRALSTALSFAEAMNMPEEKIRLFPDIYEVGSETLLRTVREKFKNKWSSALMFGHNYAYTEFANWYAQPKIDNVPTCGIVAIDYAVEKWSDVTKGNGTVRFFEYPKRYL